MVNFYVIHFDILCNPAWLKRLILIYIMKIASIQTPRLFLYIHFVSSMFERKLKNVYLIL